MSKGNVIPTKLYLPQLAPVYVQQEGDTGAKGVGTPWAEDHTCQY